MKTFLLLLLSVAVLEICLIAGLEPFTRLR
jgi:hypothetical protein